MSKNIFAIIKFTFKSYTKKEIVQTTSMVLGEEFPDNFVLTTDKKKKFKQHVEKSFQKAVKTSCKEDLFKNFNIMSITLEKTDKVKMTEEEWFLNAEEV